MLTIFTVPKSFRGHIGVIQRNAIKSWTCLRPQPEIILFGDEEGVREIALEFGIHHVPEVICNEYGTPLMDSVFDKAEKIAKNHLLCYVNADIILLSDFVKAVQSVQHKRRFLLAGKRWNMEINELINFEGANYEEKLRSRFLQMGQLHRLDGVDYFVYPRGLWGKVPPFAVGRFRWDNWLIYRTRALRAAVIDATSVIMAVHQNHSYGLGDNKKGEKLREGEEAQRNLELAGRRQCQFSLLDATHLMGSSGIRPAFNKKYLRRRLDVLPILYPTLYPRISLLVEFIKRVLQRV